MQSADDWLERSDQAAMQEAKEALRRAEEAMRDAKAALQHMTGLWEAKGCPDGASRRCVWKRLRNVRIRL